MGVSGESDFPQMVAGGHSEPAGRSDLRGPAACMEGEIVLSTSRLRVLVSRSPFLLSAEDCEGRVFWKQKGYELFTSDSFATSVAEANLSGIIR